MAEIPEETKQALAKAKKARLERWAKMSQAEKTEFQKHLEALEAFLYPETRQKEDRQAK